MDYLPILQRLGRGRMLEQLAIALASVATEVVETGQAGEVTLKLKLTTREQGDAMITVNETISRKTPTPAARGQYLFSVEGWLYDVDPRQTRLPFRSVEQLTADQRELDDAAPTIREA